MKIKLLKGAGNIDVASKFIIICILTLLSSCSGRIENPLAHALASKKEKIKRVMDSLEQYEVQILFSEIIENEDGSISFQDYEFQVDKNNYFYPASTVKFPTALLALEKLHNDKRFDKETLFFVEGDTAKSDFERELTKIFVVSENEAYNKFYEYLGRDYINKKMQEKGLSPIRIAHRLAVPDSDDSITKPLIFQENDTTLTATVAIQDSMLYPLNINKLKKGKGYYEDGVLIDEPFDFSLKNYIPLSTLHNTMKRIIVPKAFDESEQFQMSNDDRKSLLLRMRIPPRETRNYSNNDEYYDSYVKFFMYGDTKERIPEYVTIFNKVGYAYGYLTDCAYIEDNQNGVKFFITATIHVNKDGIFNDDVYEYEEIGIPFLAELGREIHHTLVLNKFR